MGALFRSRCRIPEVIARLTTIRCKRAFDKSLHAFAENTGVSVEYGLEILGTFIALHNGLCVSGGWGFNL